MPAQVAPAPHRTPAARNGQPQPQAPASAMTAKPAMTGAAARPMTPMPTICTSAAMNAVPEVRDFMGLSPGALTS